MAAQNIEQAIKQINSAKSVAIIFKGDSSGDSLCAALALGVSNRAKQKSVSIKGVGIKTRRLSFLPNFALINGEDAGDGRLLIVRVSNAAKKLNEFWYEEEGDTVKVFISAQAGPPAHRFKKEDVSIDIKDSDIKPDLTITMGVRSPESLGQFYEQNTNIFFNIPTVNIDNEVENVAYGSVNIIDLVSASLCEIVFDILEKFGDALNKDIATILLAGIIARTNSFQNVKTTPRSFFLASKLMSLGADKEEIVRHLYKTRSLSLLKLWGRTLARIKTHPDVGLVSAVLNYQDLERAEVTPDDIHIVAEDLASTLSDARAVLFMAETAPKDLRGYIFTKPSLHLEDLSMELNGEMGNGHTITFRSIGELEQAENDIGNKIQNWLKSFEKV